MDHFPRGFSRASRRILVTVVAFDGFAKSRRLK
jgi:hypothetical protein